MATAYQRRVGTLIRQYAKTVSPQKALAKAARKASAERKSHKRRARRKTSSRR